MKSEWNKVWDDAAAFSRELSSLSKEFRELQGEVKAGKMPSARKLTQIGRRLIRCNGEFSSILFGLADIH